MISFNKQNMIQTSKVDLTPISWPPFLYAVLLL